MNVNTITAFTELAFQFGPFFFALLFTLVISRWSYKIYHGEHKASTREKNTYRWVFISTTGFGMVLVIVSVVWWWNYRPTTYVFRGEIKNLKEYEKLVSSSMYFKSVWSGKLAEGVPQIHDEEFAVIQDMPFSAKQRFDMYFSKRDGAPEKVTVNYDVLDKEPQFEVVWDDSAGVNRLSRISSSSGSGDDALGNFLTRQAFAAWKKVNELPVVGPSGSAQMQVQAPILTTEEMIRILQDERSGVGNKIAAMDKILSMDAAAMRKVVSTKTSKEEMILTITDLTRHTDRELATKAKLLVKRGNVYGMISGRLGSTNATVVSRAKQLVRRLDKSQVKELMKSVDLNHAASLRDFFEQISSGKGLTPLKPTGSSQGDRYYIKASWDKNNGSTVECLTRLFNRELFGKESQAEDAVFMKSHNARWVYWYSKEWALQIASKIADCGGSASFESPLKE